MISFCITCQNLWKSLLVIPSGPGALSGLISNKAFLISCSVGSAVRVSFVVADTLFFIKRKEASISVGIEVEKRSWKYSTATFSIPPSLSTILPSLSLIQMTRFLARLCLVIPWWNFVFLSPARCHCVLLFCCQYSSSSLKAVISWRRKSSNSSRVVWSSSWAISILLFSSLISLAEFVGLFFRQEIMFRHSLINRGIKGINDLFTLV